MGDKKSTCGCGCFPLVCIPLKESTTKAMKDEKKSKEAKKGTK